MFSGDSLRANVYIALARAVNDGFDKFHTIRKKAGEDMDQWVLHDLQELEVDIVLNQSLWEQEL